MLIDFMINKNKKIKYQKIKQQKTKKQINTKKYFFP